MPATKRTRIQRARDLEIVARRYLKGESQQAIANDLGVARSQIAYDVAKLIKMWQASAVNDIAQARAIELRRINNIEAEAW
jgi:DNA-directed RNA polymerase specialized sigma subunit